MKDPEKPYRKHRWGIYNPNWNECAERCKDCCVERTEHSEESWCLNPRDERYAPFEP